MNVRVPLLINLCLLAIMAVISLWGYAVLPADLHAPIHWALNGTPNRFAGRTAILTVLPGVGLVTTALLGALPWIEPRRAHLLASRKLYVVRWVGGTALIAVLHGVVVASAAGYAVDVPLVGVGAACILIAAVGNVLGKSRSTFLQGVNLPWTLSSEYAWEKTSRLTGKLFMATGAFALLMLAAVGLQAGVRALMAGLLISMGVATLASYFYWRADPDRDTGAPRSE